jgi:signal transduction histidine kinase
MASGRFVRLAAVLVLCAAAVLRGIAAGAEPIRGLPFTRAYPLEELGNVPRGVKLNFDTYGRLAVIHDGVYSVLNDSVWVDVLDKSTDADTNMTNVVLGNDGHTYFGGRGVWGRATLGPSGKLKLHVLDGPTPPKWTRTTSFSDLVATRDGVFFAGPNGIVFLDYEKQESHVVEVPVVAKIFRIGDRVFVSCHGKPLQELDARHGAIAPVETQVARSLSVELAASLDEQHALVYTRDGRLVVFDGATVTPWEPQQRHDLRGPVSAIHRLADGGVAIAITGKGLYLLSRDGALLTALTTAEYHRIISLASGEPGVVWVAVEDAIVKVFYGSPLTSFGQRLGLSASWPAVVKWGDQVIATSSGRVYRSVQSTPGLPARFELMDPQPEGGVWAIAAKGPHLLGGNVLGVFAAKPNGKFEKVLSTEGVAYLVMLGADLAFVIGRTQIAAMRYTEGRWMECAARVAGVGQPAVVHATNRAVWIELGANRIVRVALKSGQIVLTDFSDLPWGELQWVNVGSVGDTVVLSGSVGGRVFFDERTETRCAAPELESVLNRSPYWITRIHREDSGMLWGAHRQGVVTFTPENGGYRLDTSTFDLIGDQFPMVQILEGQDIWFTGGRSLYHVDPNWPRGEAPTPRAPILVSAINGKSNLDFRHRAEGTEGRFQLSFEENSLSFRFFSGGYAWRRAPEFEYRLSEGERWTPLESGAPLRFSGLREGAHLLEVRRTAPNDAVPPATKFAFEILPPWHRTAQAYTLYAGALILAVWGIVKLTSRRARQRNSALERLVRERTSQLEVTMEKLNEETRNAATFAERNRIAGEIHDSLQQGLTGLMLQLDSTLKQTEIPADLRSRLNVARSMVSFTRQEVQHAVWDLETPLLKDGELGEALRKLAALISTGTAPIRIDIVGTPVTLPSRHKHHLLRIAQEAVTNAVRHAQAGQIDVNLAYGENEVSLEVRDDGVGFDADEVINNGAGHFGLRGLNERAAKMNAALTVRSEPGQGTSVRVVVPRSEIDLFPSHAGNR